MPAATLLLVLALAISGVPASAAPVQLASSVGTPACPAELADDEFDDVREWTTHEHAIDCVAWWGISIGDTDGRYAPRRAVTRGQIATFLDRTLAAADAAAPAATGGVYSDLPAGYTHAAAIDRLAAIGVLRPVAGDRYEPVAPLARDDMAVFLVAAWQQVTGQDLPTPTGTFPDLAGHPDRAIIEAAAALGFTSGTADGSYDPDGTVTRDRMASFLTRLLDDLVGDHGVQPPTAPAWGAVPPGRARSLPLPDAPTSSYRLMRGFDDQPVRWNPCLPIEVVVDLTGAHSGASTAARTAVDRLRDATGLDLLYLEETGHQRPRFRLPDEDPFEDYSPDDPSSWGPVDEYLQQFWEDVGSIQQAGRIVITWPDRWEAPRGLAGMASTDWVSDSIVSSVIVVQRAIPSSQEDLTALLMHELGHAVGLDHPDDRDQIMGRISGHGARWTAGDLAGLARVGRGMGCPAQPFPTREQ